MLNFDYFEFKTCKVEFPRFIYSSFYFNNWHNLLQSFPDIFNHKNSWDSCNFHVRRLHTCFINLHLSAQFCNLRIIIHDHPHCKEEQKNSRKLFSLAFLSRDSKERSYAKKKVYVPFKLLALTIRNRFYDREKLFLLLISTLDIEK